MAENTLHTLGYGDWVISMYNPAVNVSISGALKLVNGLYIIYDKNEQSCLGVFPSANIGGIFLKGLEAQYRN